jgi:hypothetical protein
MSESFTPLQWTNVPPRHRTGASREWVIGTAMLVEKKIFLAVPIRPMTTLSGQGNEETHTLNGSLWLMLSPSEFPCESHMKRQE